MKLTNVVQASNAMPQGGSSVLDEGNYILELNDIFITESRTSKQERLVFNFDVISRVVSHDTGERELEPESSNVYYSFTPYLTGEHAGEANQIGAERLLQMIAALLDIKSWDDLVQRFNFEYTDNMLNDLKKTLLPFAKTEDSPGEPCKAWLSKDEYDRDGETREVNRVSQFKYIDEDLKQKLGADVPF